MQLVQANQRLQLDWYSQCGLNFLQLRMRDIARRCYERITLPLSTALPEKSPSTTIKCQLFWVLPSFWVRRAKLGYVGGVKVLTL